MSGEPPGRDGDEDAEIAAILEAYLAEFEGGHPPDPGRLLDLHPALAGRLRHCLAGLELVEAAGAAMDVVRTELEQEDGAPPPLGGYRILRELGRGGMGVVYEAVQLGAGRKVALKVILAGEFASATDVKRFQAEAEAIAGLDHPHIVPLYEVGEDRGRHYYSMKRFDGGTLAEAVGSHRHDGHAAARLVATVARAVHHAHRRGILHRDLKPGNILLDGEGRPYVGDFGLARRIEGDPGLTQTDAIVGSPAYLAPEQAAGRRGSITVATDVYGLGAILYALLAGRPPFRGDSPLETLEQVRTRPPEPPGAIDRTLDRDLEAICLKCLEKDPERRYASALALAEDLDRFLAGEPTLARPLGPLGRLGRWARRRRRAILATAVALPALLVLAAGLALLQDLRQARRLAREQQDAIRRRDDRDRALRYAADIRHAARSIANGEARTAEELLGRHRAASGESDLRGFEWHYLQRQTHRELASWDGHDGHEVYRVEFAPDGRTLASCGADGTARLRDAVTGEEVARLRGHTDEVNWVTFAPDSKTLATASDDRTVRLWSAADGEPIRTLPAQPAPVVAVLFTPDGRHLVSGSRDGNLKRFDASTGRELADLATGIAIEGLALTGRDGSLLAAYGSGSNVLLFDLDDGDSLTAHPLRDAGPDRPENGIATVPERVLGLAFSPDGRTLAATGTGNLHARLSEARTGRTDRDLEGPSTSVFAVAFAPDGRTLAAGDHAGVLRLWDIEEGRLRATLLGHTERIWSVAYSPDGRTLATAGRDRTIKLWDPARAHDQTVLRGLAEAGPGRAGSRASSVAFAGDGSRVVAANREGAVQVWELGTGRVVETRPPVQAGSWGTSILAPDGKALAVAANLRRDSVGDEWFAVVDLDRDRGTTRLPIHRELPPGGFAFSPDGLWLAVPDDEGSLLLWDMRLGYPAARLAAGYGSGSSNPTFSARGDRLAVFCFDERRGSVACHTWELPSGRLRSVRSGGVPYATLALSPDGGLLAEAEEPYAIRLRDAATLEERAILRGHRDRIEALTFAPDGRTLAGAGLDQVVRLWNVATGEELLALEGHSGPVAALAFAPGGRALASCASALDHGVEVIVWHADVPSVATRPRAGVGLPANDE